MNKLFLNKLFIGASSKLTGQTSQYNHIAKSINVINYQLSTVLAKHSHSHSFNKQLAISNLILPKYLPKKKKLLKTT